MTQTVNTGYAFEQLETVIPHNIMPQHRSNPSDYGTQIFTEEQWNAYQWNPPGWLRDGDSRKVFDPDADPKPTWAELVEAQKQFHLKRERTYMYRTIDKQATDRINALYNVNVKNPKRYREELINRIVPDYPSAADTIRLEIIAKYHEFKTAIQQATSLATLEDMDITSDVAWGQDDEGEES